MESLTSRKLIYLGSLCLVLLFPATLTAQKTTELIIRNGTIATSEGRYMGDIRIIGETITEIGQKLPSKPSSEEIDATGMLVIPGGIDPHTHLSIGEDNYTTGSAAALAGGMTTISNFLTPKEGETFQSLISRGQSQIDSEAIADIFLHSTINDPTGRPEQINELKKLGQTSTKVFMNRPVFEEKIEEYLAMLNAAGEAGVMSMMHCEDGPILSHAVAQLTAAGHTSLEHYPESRPLVGEVVATQRAVGMAEATGAPIYIVHMSSEGALRVAQDAQTRGLPVYVETRPIYLHLTGERYDEEDRGLYIGQPPLREQSDQDAMWTGIANGTVHVVGTDHVPYSKATKMDPNQTIARHHAGMSNLQLIRPMIYSEGVVNNRISLERFIAVTATNPAKLFGLFPRKGTIAIGSDADIVIWDPKETRTVRDEDMLSGSGYSTYAGWQVTGWPIITIRRGEIVYKNGQIVGKAGTGELLHRGRWSAP